MERRKQSHKSDAVTPSTTTTAGTLTRTTSKNRQTMAPFVFLMSDSLAQFNTDNLANYENLNGETEV